LRRTSIVNPLNSAKPMMKKAPTERMEAVLFVRYEINPNKKVPITAEAFPHSPS